MLQPSKPGRQFSSADLVRAEFTPAQMGKIIMGQSAPGATIDVLGLLAAILKTQKKQNARFLPVPFDFAAWTLQQVLPENPARNYLMVQNVGNGDLMVVHESGPTAPQDFSADASSQLALTVMQTRAIRIVSGGYYEPLTAPTNPISIFTVNAITNGVVIEGA